MHDVICNTSPLQYLHQADLLHLLPALFRSVQVPSAVAAELAEGRRRGFRLTDLEDLPWVTVRSVQDRRLLPLGKGLGKGEKEVLAFGQEHILCPGKPLRAAIEVGRAHSMIFWGPPDTGKTTLGRLVATRAMSNGSVAQGRPAVRTRCRSTAEKCQDSTP